MWITFKDNEVESILFTCIIHERFFKYIFYFGVLTEAEYVYKVEYSSIYYSQIKARFSVFHLALRFLILKNNFSDDYVWSVNSFMFKANQKEMREN